MLATLHPRFQTPDTRETLIDELVRLEWSEPGSLALIELALDAGRLVGNVTVSSVFGCGDAYGHAARLDRSRARSLQARARVFQRDNRDDYSILEELVLSIERGATPDISPILYYLKHDIFPLASLRFLTRSQIWAKQLAARLLPERPFHQVCVELERLRSHKDGPGDSGKEERAADHLVMAAVHMNTALTSSTMESEQILRLHGYITQWLKGHPQAHEQVQDDEVRHLLVVMFGAAISPYGDLIAEIEATLQAG